MIILQIQIFWERVLENLSKQGTFPEMMRPGIWLELRTPQLKKLLTVKIINEALLRKVALLKISQKPFE